LFVKARIFLVSISKTLNGRKNYAVVFPRFFM
jgi:hypothetical protein